MPRELRGYLDASATLSTRLQPNLAVEFGLKPYDWLTGYGFGRLSQLEHAAGVGVRVRW